MMRALLEEAGRTIIGGLAWAVAFALKGTFTGFAAVASCLPTN